MCAMCQKSVLVDWCKVKFQSSNVIKTHPTIYKNVYKDEEEYQPSNIANT